MKSRALTLEEGGEKPHVRGREGGRRQGHWSRVSALVLPPTLPPYLPNKSFCAPQAPKLQNEANGDRSASLQAPQCQKFKAQMSEVWLF